MGVISKFKAKRAYKKLMKNINQQTEEFNKAIKKNRECLAEVDALIEQAMNSTSK